MTITFIIAVVSVFGIYAYSSLSLNNKIKKRKLLEFDALYLEWCAVIGEQDIDVVRYALKKIESIFSIPYGYLKLTDEFGKELGRRNILSTVDSDACEELYRYIDGKAVSMGLSDYDPVLTVCDFVMFELSVSKKLKGDMNK